MWKKAPLSHRMCDMACEFTPKAHSHLCLTPCWSCFMTSRCITYHEFQGCLGHHSLQHQSCLYAIDLFHLLAIIASHWHMMGITIFCSASNSSPHILEVHSLLCLDVHPMFSIEFKNTFQTYLKRIYYHHCWTCIQHSSWMANVFFMYWTLRRCNLHVVKKWWRGDLLTTSYVLARWWVITCRFCY